MYIYIKPYTCALGSTTVVDRKNKHIHESTRCWNSWWPNDLDKTQVTNGGLHQFALHLKLVTWTWTTILFFFLGGEGNVG